MKKRLKLEKTVRKVIEIEVELPAYYELDFLQDHSDEVTYGMITDKAHLKFEIQTYPMPEVKFSVDEFYPRTIEVMGLSEYLLNGDYSKRISEDKFYRKLDEASRRVAKLIGFADAVKASLKDKRV